MADPWRNCLASLTLVDWINARWPKRDKTSDGTIGDAAHATRSSDHNPWVKNGGWGIVRARDVDVDGIDAAWIVERLRLLGAAGDPRLAGGGYVIFNRRITKPDFSGWAVYKGTNPHDHHFHVSFSLNAAGYDSTAGWGGIGAGGTSSPITTLPVQEDDDMFNDEDRALLKSIGLWADPNKGELTDRIRGLTFPKPGSPVGPDATERSHYVPVDSARLIDVYTKVVTSGQVSAQDVAAAMLPGVTAEVRAAIVAAGGSGDAKVIAAAVLDGLAARVAA